MKVIAYFKMYGIISILLFSSLCHAQNITSIQNITPYTFTLSNITLKSATCVPSCIKMSVLLPEATQDYKFSASTGYIYFDYDINEGTSYIGHITIIAHPTLVSITNGLGASIKNGVSAAQISYIPPVPFWTGKFNNIKDWTSNNWSISSSLPKWGSNNVEVLPSILNDRSPYNDNYLRIHYPAGSANSGASPPLPLGGAQFYGAMFTSNTPITLSFYVRFPKTFPFKRLLSGTTTIGKLPGLYGGRGNTGSNVPSGYDGWSTRFMWCDWNSTTNAKPTGGGELLQFTYGSNLGLHGTKNGIFLDCGNWHFLPDGKWHNIQQTVYLNTPGKNNGRIDVCYDGKLIFTQGGITFRKDLSLQINGILFQSFFGGSGESYATPIDTYADFADFALYQHPQTAAPVLCVTNVNIPP